ncbi:DUF447 domain-containing protein [uncultured Methanobrevibacter sp.]|uniref:DUF447 domain-containing protein n=1 Tax=uncultured Methanobrevibacter sp. TaxID=253161 RepID=UPI00262BE58B
MEIDLKKLGMEKGQQYETIITTVNKDGKSNTAPFGLRVLDKDKIQLGIFEGGNTIKNLQENNEFIVNVSSNPIMFTLASINTIPEEHITRIKKEDKELAYFTETDAYFICEIESIKAGLRKDQINESTRYHIKANVKEICINKKCPKVINRGIHALIESLVNYSRINIVNEEMQEYYIERIKESERIIKKVGSAEEKEAINILVEELRKEKFDI